MCRPSIEHCDKLQRLPLLQSVRPVSKNAYTERLILIIFPNAGFILREALGYIIKPGGLLLKITPCRMVSQNLKT